MKNVLVGLTFLAGMFTCAVLLNISSCTREDAVIGEITPPDYQYGDATIKTSEGWNFDKAHSSVMWESPYKGVSALLTGRFNTFATTVEFEENHPEHTVINGFVVLSSVNTGEPGRDGGCLLNTFGVSDISDTARLVSKQILKDGKGGYTATMELDFHGVKKEVPMTLKFTGLEHIDGNNPYTVGGLSGEFTFNAISDFGIVTTNIADAVTVRINATFKKPD
ncbi:MAG: YceI family protein [Bacteroidetes bacterium]|nr:MAG: YceI family protein [Bacteroidota bacterium]